MHFGDWLKRYRMIYNLTQQVVADQLGYAVITYRRVEQGNPPSIAFVNRLIDYLQLPDDEEAIFRHFALTHDHPDAQALLVRLTQATDTTTTAHISGASDTELIHPIASVIDNLPSPRTTLIGRADETHQIRELLQQSAVRLVTLIGPGGVGKTHLVLHLAAELRADFPNGVCLVDLTAVTDSSTVMSVIARTLNIHEQHGSTLLEQIQAYLSRNHMLLVLDNFEQVIDAAPEVVRLLDTVVHLKLLITSRVRLQVQGEYSVTLSPLRLPPLDPLPSLAELVTVPAVALLLSRMQAVQSEVGLTATNAGTLAAICHQVSGLPLALELAAVHLRVLSPKLLLERLVAHQEELAARVRDGPSRHRSMQATIEWSYQLLRPDEQRLFVRLAVFHGGATLEAIEQVCGEAPTSETAQEALQLVTLTRPVIDLLATLLDSSLITRVIDAEGAPRFGMLVPIHTYAKEQLKGSAEGYALNFHHARYYLVLAEQAATQLRGPHSQMWLERLEREYPNLRAALSWMIRHDQTSLAFQLGAVLSEYWNIRDHIHEAEHWFTKLLSLQNKPITSSHITILCGYGYLLFNQGAFTKARQCYDEGWYLARQLADQQGMAAVLDGLGNIAYRYGSYADATQYYEESLTISQCYDDPPGMARALVHLGMVAHAQGDLIKAHERYQASLKLSQAIGDTFGVTANLANIGLVAWSQNDISTAYQSLSELLRLMRELNNKSRIADCLVSLGKIALSQGDITAAQQYLVESVPLLRELADQSRVADCLDNLAGVCGQLQSPVLAARFWGAAEAIRVATSMMRRPSDESFYEEMIAETCTKVDRTTWEAAWLAGKQLSWYEALNEVLELEWFSQVDQDGKNV